MSDYDIQVARVIFPSEDILAELANVVCCVKEAAVNINADRPNSSNSSKRVTITRKKLHYLEK